MAMRPSGATTTAAFLVTPDLRGGHAVEDHSALVGTHGVGDAHLRSKRGDLVAGFVQRSTPNSVKFRSMCSEKAATPRPHMCRAGISWRHTLHHDAVNWRIRDEAFHVWPSSDSSV